MPIASTARIHPTAVVSPDVDLADRVEIGPYAILEGPVRLGPGCVVRPHAHLIGPLTMGRDNLVFTGCVLGERPQHLKYADEPTGVEIGDCNQFREYVTVHRATTHSWQTRIGSHNLFMANCHVAHDCQIGNHCIVSNGALIAGHCIVADCVFLSGNCAVHQFVRIGRLSLLSGVSATSKDIPPFAIQQGFNQIGGVNVVGMRRAGMTAAQIDAIRTSYHLLFRGDELISVAAARVEQILGAVDVVAELLAFIRGSHRGVTTMREHNRHHHAA